MNIQKRDGNFIKFDKKRITKAIFAAAKSVGGKNIEIADSLANEVIKKIEANYQNKTLTVEIVQDIVEKVLINFGHAKTAKSYILYRQQRNQEREEKKRKIIEQINKKEALITLKDGSVVIFDSSKMLSEIEVISKGFKEVNIYNLFLKACSHLYNGIHYNELETSLINSARERIEISSEYSFLASRLLLEKFYKEVIGLSLISKTEKFEKKYQNSFEKYLETGIKNLLLDPKLKEEFDIEQIKQAISPKNDLLFHYRGIKTLHERYLLKILGKKQFIFELPQYFWMRIAMGLALAEKSTKTKYAIDFYECISQMDYVPSTPTLFNSGTTHPQLSSCFLNTTQDSLKDIFKSFSDNAKLSKYAGGIGTDWTPVRSLGSIIKGTNGVSQGVIPFLKIFNDVAVAVNQGGKRKGAMCAYLEFWHGDVEEFLESKKNTGDDRRRLHDVHTAVWVPDLFMKRLENNQNWTLFSPSDVPDLHDLYGLEFVKKYEEYEKQKLPSAKTIPAQFLWKKTITMLFETGHPWITFKDACNIRNTQDHVGVIHNSNLCTEITLNNSADETATCNLGSLNLSKMITDGKLDHSKLKQTIFIAMRMLDNVIDITYYPTKEAKNSNTKHRPVGLGVMGYQDSLYQLDISFSSMEQLKFSNDLMEIISYYAIQKSADLATEKGSYSSFKGSKWDRSLFPLDTYKLLAKTRGGLLEYDESSTMDWDSLKKKVKKNGMRNSNCLAIAPTATISNIAGTIPCIEPIFRNIYSKENTDGSFIVINNYLVEELKKEKLWNKEMLNKIKYYDGSLSQITEIPHRIRYKYQNVFEIDTDWLIRAAALRSKWIDQSQSLNIFTASISGKILSNIYNRAWKLGLKTTYYLRSLSASQIDKNINIKELEKEKTVVKKSTTRVEDIETTCESCQ